jgi:beta-glucanase (GH16 family)
MRSMEAERVVRQTARQDGSTRRDRVTARREQRFRRLRRTLLAAVLALVVAGTVVFLTRSSGDGSIALPTKGAVLLRDDFNDAALSSEHWSPCYWWSSEGCTNLGNNELEWYVPDQATVAGGVLTLEARQQAITGVGGRTFSYVSGMISGLSPSRALFSFRYGYVEARVQVPEGQGLWPAL